MRSPFASFNIPSCAGSLAQAYCSVKSSFMSYHSFCPRYDTRVKAYLNLSASKSDTAWLRYIYYLLSFLIWNLKVSLRQQCCLGVPHSRARCSQREYGGAWICQSFSMYIEHHCPHSIDNTWSGLCWNNHWWNHLPNGGPTCSGGWHIWWWLTPSRPLVSMLTCFTIIVNKPYMRDFSNDHSPPRLTRMFFPSVLVFYSFFYSFLSCSCFSFVLAMFMLIFILMFWLLNVVVFVLAFNLKVLLVLILACVLPIVFTCVIALTITFYSQLFWTLKLCYFSKYPIIVFHIYFMFL